MPTLSGSRKSKALIAELRRLGIRNSEVLSAIQSIPRERFVAEALTHKAYQNTALPIGQGQTISQPYIVAKMTEKLLGEIPKNSKILEIGTGCGYQTAVLASLFQQVFSVERIKSLQFHAKRRLHQLDLHNVSMKHGDGWQGWASKAPFDGIIVTAAAATLPSTLCQQLKPSGRLIIPLGEQQQQLFSISRHRDNFTQEVIENVKFVPLIQGDII